jgi:hypothetical protein
MSNSLLQTGSGKTFTITGGAERYSDRGIIPRTLSYMFDCFEKVVNTLTCKTYIEIKLNLSSQALLYNEQILLCLL